MGPNPTLDWTFNSVCRSALISLWPGHRELRHAGNLHVSPLEVRTIRSEHYYTVSALLYEQ